MALSQSALLDLIEAEATALIGAERHERTDARTVQRNGHRPRTLSTTTGGSVSATQHLDAVTLPEPAAPGVARTPVRPQCDDDHTMPAGRRRPSN